MPAGGAELIFFVGPRACGKTTTGGQLARQLALPFEDTDVCLQRDLGMSVAQIVAERGWGYFRELESVALREVAGRLAAGGGIIATGGGMVLKAENRAYMRSMGRVFFLSAPARLLAARLAADPQGTLRPPLTCAPAKDEVPLVLAERDLLYRETAHHILDAACSPEKICRRIAAILRNCPNPGKQFFTVVKKNSDTL
ncbi:MAG: shikimate kinase AroL [Desulfovibrio sp.]|jgi:shikimate kinase|nr:shikimate kinase AroL [Desulfovibrio sp.]